MESRNKQIKKALFAARKRRDGGGPTNTDTQPGYIEKSLEGLTRGVREFPGAVSQAVKDWYERGSEAAHEGQAMIGRGVEQIGAGQPASGVGNIGMGLLSQAISPITGLERPVEKTTGNPQFAERALMVPFGPESLLMKTAPAMAAVTAVPRGALSAMQAAKTERELSPLGFYSHGAEAASALPQAKGTPEQMRGMLERAGVKPAELEGFNEAFAGRPSITREEVAQHFRQAMPQVEETILKDRPTSEQVRIYHDMSPEMWGGLPVRDYRQLYNEYLANEKINGTPKFSEFQLPGGENYREVLLKLPTEFKPVIQEKYGRFGFEGPDGKYRDYWSKSDAEQAAKSFYRESGFTSSHWDDPNVLAHLRMADRTGPNGEKMLHVEEMQSDWGQQGRKEGFGTKLSGMPKMSADELLISHGDRMNNNQKQWLKNFISEWENANKQDGDINALIDKYDKWVEKEKLPGIPAAPYVTSTQGWTDLALKRVLKEAAEGGYDKVVFTPGAEQAARYDLSKHVDTLSWDPKTNELRAFKGDEPVIQNKIVPKEKLAENVGKEVAERLVNSKPTQFGWHMLEGQDLSVGGEGMRSYYDKIVPTQINKLVSKYDKSAKTKLHDVELPTKEGGTTRGHVIEITPKMREAITSGQTAFARGGNVNVKSTPPSIHRALDVSYQHAPPHMDAVSLARTLSGRR